MSSATFCSIYDYLLKHDKKLADAIEQGCARSSLRGGRNFAGITFLVPQDKGVRKALIDGLPHADAAKSAAAVELLNRHVLVDVYPDAAAFAGVSKVPNRNRKAVSVQTSGAKVEFAGGAVAKPVKDFAVPRRNNMAVWTLDGVIEEGAEPAAAFTRAERKAVVKGGGGGLRAKVTLMVENLWRDWDGRNLSPYEIYTAALLAALARRNQELYAALAPVVSKCAVATWYVLAEPYSDGDRLVPDAVFADAFHELGFPNEKVDGGALASAYAAGAGAMKPGAVAAVSHLRTNIDVQYSNKNVFGQLDALYQTFAAGGTIDGHRYFPEATFERIKNKKRVQDEVRFFVAQNVGQTRVGSREQVASEFGAFVATLRDLFGGKRRLLGSADRIAPNEAVAAATDFVKSGCFFYFPV